MTVPSLSTDQVAAFVQLARWGSLRAAAKELHITEQGVRSRLLALEKTLGVSLYHKRRGIRRVSPLTSEGSRFLSQAEQFLERATELSQLFREDATEHEVCVAASQYLIAYVLIDAVRRFHDAYPDIRILLSAHAEKEIERALRDSPMVRLGVAAPYEASNDFDYQHLFSMEWSLITPKKHELLKHDRVRLSQLVDYPLITYERGSTGREHVLEAFRKRNLSPDIEVETTNTDLIVRMVEAGLGIAVAPLLPSGAVTKGRRVGIRPLGTQVRSIDSGILTRRGERLNQATEQFIRFINSEWGK